MKPVILTVFANDNSGSLSLNSERKALEGIFDNSDKIVLEVIEGATSSRIFNKITDPDLKQRIVIFHYAGHAGNNYVDLLDGEARALGLAHAISMLPNLQLVFLNGCDTIGHSTLLLSLGVKAVITTFKPVNDTIAVDFAKSFYNAFYRFNTLNDSFEFAKSYILTKFKSDNLRFIKVNRGFGEEDIKEDTDIIYSLSSKNEEYLKTTLFFQVDYQAPNPKNFGYEPNKDLIYKIAESILQGNYFVGEYESLTIENKFRISHSDPDNNRKFHELSDQVLDVLPFPIGFHIGILLSLAQGFSGNWDKQIELLNRQIITYNSLIQLLSFTLLSCFWKELERNHNLSISLSQWKVLREFLSSNELNNQDINYPALLVTIREVLASNHLDPFISEYQKLKDIFESEEGFYDAHLHMQGLKSSIRNNEIKRMDIKWLCYETEQILGKIFSKSGFIVRYKLTTVKEIEFTKSRLREPSYFIKRIILDRSTVIEADVVSYSNFTDSHSVILAKGVDANNFTDFLSLSPFIIDENSLKGEDLSKLYFYSHSEGNTYVYRWAEDPKKTLVINENGAYDHLYEKTKREVDVINRRMAEVKKEIDAFKTLISI